MESDWIYLSTLFPKKVCTQIIEALLAKDTRTAATTLPNSTPTTLGNGVPASMANSVNSLRTNPVQHVIRPTPGNTVVGTGVAAHPFRINDTTFATTPQERQERLLQRTKELKDRARGKFLERETQRFTTPQGDQTTNFKND